MIGVAFDTLGLCSDTAWTVEDYNPSLIELADEINPGQSNVRLIASTVGYTR